MKAVAVRDFNASVNGRDFRCEAGDEVEADAKTIGQLEAIGLVSTNEKLKQGAKKPRKAAKND